MSRRKNEPTKTPNASLAKGELQTAQIVERAAWYRTPFALSLISAILLWASFPPLGLSLLAWIAPLGWLRLIQQEKFFGRWPYLAIWMTSSLHWLALLQGVRKAHPVLHLGWIALSLYLAVYIALFVAITRVAVLRWKIPLTFAAPVIWVGLEAARSHFLTGFALALLGHTQVKWPEVIQIADIFGAYGVSFLVMLIAGCMAEMCWPRTQTATDGTAALPSRPRFPAVVVIATFLAVLGYAAAAGAVMIAARSESPSMRVALIQQSVDTIFEYNPDRNAETFDKYRELTLETCRAHPDLQMIVWPESMLSANSPAFFFEEEKVPDIHRDAANARSQQFDRKVRDLMREIRAASSERWVKEDASIMLLAGCDAVEVEGSSLRVLNSALLLDTKGDLKDRYAKMHLVMFGEYIPFADTFPWLYKITPMPMGLTRGTGPKSFEVAGLRVMPNVCFESTVPHLIRRQFADLSRNSQTPDILVNVSNDGWFWGSSILDLHLACSVFRAVELRRPVLIAANTGISAAIDASGEVSEQLPKRTPGAIVRTIQTNSRNSLYARYGDVGAWLCCAFTGFVTALSFRRRGTS